MLDICYSINYTLVIKADYKSRWRLEMKRLSDTDFYTMKLEEVNNMIDKATLLRTKATTEEQKQYQTTIINYLVTLGDAYQGLI